MLGRYWYQFLCGMKEGALFLPSINPEKYRALWRNNPKKKEKMFED
jgi:hypothetical protein